MKLRHELKQVIFVNHTDLENLIFSEYGIDYEISVGEDESIDSLIKYDVVKQKLDDELLEGCKTRKNYFILRRVLWDLAYRELIDEGTYIIKL